MNTVCIVEQPLEVKEWNGQRVITFKDVDRVHKRPDGTASRNFRQNKKRFILGKDYFEISPDEIRRNKIMDVPIALKRAMIFLTEIGYLMLAKSLTDDLAWDVQRALVNNYFRGRQPVQQQLPMKKPMPERKTWNGVPVMTTGSVAVLLQCSRDDVQHWASQCDVCGMVLTDEYLRAFKRENNSHSTAWRIRILYRHDVEAILYKAGREGEFKSLLDDYFMPDHALDHEDMRFAVRQADLLYKIAREIKDPVVKEMNLKAVTALLIDIGLWNEKHACFNGVTSNWDINSPEGWNKDRALNEAKRYWPW